VALDRDRRDVYSRRETDRAAAFLHRPTEKHDIADTEFLVDAPGCLTALARGGRAVSSTILTETTTKNSFTSSPCGSDALTRSRMVIDPARNGGYGGLTTNTDMVRTKR